MHHFKLCLSIAWRYLFSKKTTNVINLLNRISMLGMAVGATALVILLSTFNGLSGLIFSLFNQFQSDLLVTSTEGKFFEVNDHFFEKINALEFVELYASSIEEKAYLKFEDQELIATIKGVEQIYFQLNDFDSVVVYGSRILNEDGFNYALLGAGVDHVLSPSYSYPKPIGVYLPKRDRKQRLLVEQNFNRGDVYPGGVFSVQQQEFDSEYAFMDLAFVQQLLRLPSNGIGQIELKLKPNFDVNKAKVALESTLGPAFKVKTRLEQRANLHRIMVIEKWVLFAILFFVLLIISFNILGALSMLVLEKTTDIGIMRAFGASNRFIQTIFLFEGMLSSILGGFIGIVIGLIVCWVQIEFGIIKLGSDTSTFIIDAYPVEVQPLEIALVGLCILVIGTLAAIFPARQAAKKAIALKGS